MAATRFQTQDQWALIPGPAELAEPMDSLHIQDIVEISPVAIARSLLSFPGVELLHAETPSWWDWRARWKSGCDYIEIGMTIFENDSQSRGGSHLTADCSLKDIESLWSHLQARHRGVWLHNSDCMIHTPDSFRLEMST
jgi:hypothetical protein